MNKIDCCLSKKGFKTIHMIGKGGYAHVFSVKWERYPTETYVAKVISLGSKNDKKYHQSYSNEIQTLSSLFHKNIIKIYQHFLCEEHLTIIMEFCKDGSFNEYINNHGPLSPDSFKNYARQCIEGILYCHQNGIAHRDIKPSNILLGEADRVIICDFGLADPSKPEYITRHDGSLPFVSPEGLGVEPYDPKKADIFSLGITFYFFIVGKLPWTGKTKDDLKTEIIFRTLTFPAGVPQDIQSLILLMTQKEADSRPLASDLLKFPMFNNLPHLNKNRAKTNIPLIEFLKPVPRLSTNINLKRAVSSCRNRHSLMSANRFAV